MDELKKHIDDENYGLYDTLAGNSYIPNLKLPEENEIFVKPIPLVKPLRYNEAIRIHRICPSGKSIIKEMAYYAGTDKKQGT